MSFPSLTPEAELRRMVGARITRKGVPVIFPTTVRVRYGSDETCQVCGQQIDRFRVEYQVTDAREARELAFHVLCYRVWQLECRRLSVQTHGRKPDCSRSAENATQRSSSRPW